MAKPNLIEIFGAGGEHDDKIRLQYDKNTNELYVNNRKVITEVDFSLSEKILAWIVALSVAVQSLMSIFSYFKCSS